MTEDKKRIIALGKGSSGGGGDAVWGSIGGTITDQRDLMTELNKKANKSSLATVATSGDYDDLTNKPTIPSKTSDLNNDSGYITISDVPAQVQSDWNESDTNSPAYIVGKPSIPAAQIQSDWNQSDNQAVDYIKNKPTIPAAQVNADWNAVSGVAQILNKPTIPAAQVNSDWNASSGVAQILNKPSMTTTTLTFVDANNVETNVVVYTQPTI